MVYKNSSLMVQASGASGFINCLSVKLLIGLKDNIKWSKGASSVRREAKGNDSMIIKKFFGT